MAYVIAEPCIGTKDAACVDACPVDCIHPKKDAADLRMRISFLSIRWSVLTAARACRCARCRLFMRRMICRRSGRSMKLRMRNISGGRYCG
jgi:Na+-translocating ferredoxin:NAD+ oxidoreductase RNF subunit RnfB